MVTPNQLPSFRTVFSGLGLGGAALFFFTTAAWASTNVYLVDVPDYDWYYGCMGTASGNLMGFWDRHGFPDFYTGPANGGLAPLTTTGPNQGIVSLWASRAGMDGRPANQPGHVDDYYVGYESTSPDPYVTLGRPEHTPDCLCDFLGINQMKWANLAGECRGNIDAYSFVYWETNGARRVDYEPTDSFGTPVPDIQSGLRAWTQFRGYDCSVFTQLADFNPRKPLTAGFTFDDLRAEIDSGYPVLIFMQPYYQLSRNFGSVTNVNPEIHSMLAFGYYVADNGLRYVKYKTSWGGSGLNTMSWWSSQSWQANLPVRGFIGYHPIPRIRRCSLSAGNLALQWDGPAADLYNSTTGATNRVHGYVVEMSASLETPNFAAVSPVLLTNTFTVADCPSPSFFRIHLVKP